MKTANLTAVVLATLIVLSGCASAPQKETVFIPVAAEKPALPARPDLPISALKEGDACNVVVPAYVQTVSILVGHVEVLEDLLDAKKK